VRIFSITLRLTDKNEEKSSAGYEGRTEVLKHIRYLTFLEIYDEFIASGPQDQSHLLDPYTGINYDPSVNIYISIYLHIVSVAVERSTMRR
jgi:hypothetical protein